MAIEPVATSASSAVASAVALAASGAPFIAVPIQATPGAPWWGGTVVGAAVTAIATILTLVLTNRAQARRDEAKAAVDFDLAASKARIEAEQARRAILRGHLEKIVTLVHQHTAKELAMLDAHGGEMMRLGSRGALLRSGISVDDGHTFPKFGADLAVQPLDEATALAGLYFPVQLASELLAIRNASVVLSDFRRAELRAFSPDPAAWYEGAMYEGYWDRSRSAVTELLAASEALVKTASGLLQEALLPTSKPEIARA